MLAAGEKAVEGLAWIRQTQTAKKAKNGDVGWLRLHPHEEARLEAALGTSVGDDTLRPRERPGGTVAYWAPETILASQQEEATALMTNQTHLIRSSMRLAMVGDATSQ